MKKYQTRIEYLKNKLWEIVDGGFFTVIANENGLKPKSVKIVTKLSNPITDFKLIPDTVEAVLWTGENIDEVEELLQSVNCMYPRLGEIRSLIVQMYSGARATCSIGEYLVKDYRNHVTAWTKDGFEKQWKEYKEVHDEHSESR